MSSVNNPPPSVPPYTATDVSAAAQAFSDIKQLAETVEALLLAIEQQGAQLKEMRDQLKALQQQLADKKAALAAHKQQDPTPPVQGSNESDSAFQTRLSSFNEEHEKWEAELTRLEEDVANLEAAVTSLSEQIDTVIESIENDFKEVDDLNKKIEELGNKAAEGSDASDEASSDAAIDEVIKALIEYTERIKQEIFTQIVEASTPYSPDAAPADVDAMAPPLNPLVESFQELQPKPTNSGLSQE